MTIDRKYHYISHDDANLLVAVQALVLHLPAVSLAAQFAVVTLRVRAYPLLKQAEASLIKSPHVYRFALYLIN